MKYFIFITLFLFAGCSSDKVNIPRDIIQKDKMIKILVDVHIADAMAIEQKLKDVKKSNQLKKTYLNGVLLKHNITIENYEKSISFYEKNLETMLDIYNEVMVEITQKEAEINKQEKKK